MVKTDEDILSWLRLIRSEKVGPVTFWQLLHRYGSAPQALQALQDLSRQGNYKYKIASEEDAAKELRAHHKQGYSLIPAFDPAFPQLLRPLPDCPPMVSVYGKVEILNQPTLGIVGARNSSLNGRHFAERLAVDLGKAGWKIASGLARGVDRYAHQGALATGTIAVIAGGIDRIYPPEHHDLYHAIAKTGAVISEMPLSLFPGASHFPRRNRLISGLSRGVIIIEAALKSGSLITARTTLEQGRELFAVPGSPLDPRCKGTNSLIRQGAGLVESAEDVLSMMEGPCVPCVQDGATQPYVPPVTLDWESLEADVFQDLSPTPISLDAILDRHAVPPQTILTLMLEWELQGRIQRHPGNMVSVIS
ncbi:MAG: DNA-processing protein DprA [Alphaproteobacteria bacterium]|jgi:DNA processing protein|nr:DNA-processing protein DprA [Alphaproteobacteria bacterium]